MKRKMRGVDGRSEYEIARDRAEAGEDDDDDGNYLTLIVTSLRHYNSVETIVDVFCDTLSQHRSTSIFYFVTMTSAEDDEFYDDDDDMDGLDIDMEDLMATTGEDAEGSVINALKKTITEGLGKGDKNDLQTYNLQSVSTPARGLPANVKMYVNDIDDELTGKKATFSLEDASIAPVDESKRKTIKRLKLPKGVSAESFAVAPVERRERIPAQYVDVTGEAAHLDNEDREVLMTQGEFEKSLVDDSVCICQRCFKLQQYGTVEESLRPGWSDHELLTPERFENLLSCIRETEAVVLCIVDVFDLKGSLLANLKQIAGTNPIVIAANKVDLLPRDVSAIRLTSWIHAEVKEYCDLQSPKEVEDIKRQEMIAQGWHRPSKGEDEGLLRRSNVHLVSCQSGVGMSALMGSLIGLAADNGNKVLPETVHASLLT